MRSQVAERRADISGQNSGIAGRNDAFTLLVKANEDEEAKKLQLDDQELVCVVCEGHDSLPTSPQIGNVYVMLFAGHGAFILFISHLTRDLIQISLIQKPLPTL